MEASGTRVYSDLRRSGIVIFTKGSSEILAFRLANFQTTTVLNLGPDAWNILFC